MSTVAKLSPAQVIQELLNAPEVKEAFRFFDEQADAITDEHIRICSVPASPFAEQQRAEAEQQRGVALQQRAVAEAQAAEAQRQRAIAESEQAKAETRQFAKRQATWIRRHMIAWRYLETNEMERNCADIISNIDF
jgi:hypothetical protein